MWGTTTVISLWSSFVMLLSQARTHTATSRSVHSIDTAGVRDLAYVGFIHHVTVSHYSWFRTRWAMKRKNCKLSTPFSGRSYPSMYQINLTEMQLNFKFNYLNTFVISTAQKLTWCTFTFATFLKHASHNDISFFSPRKLR